MAKKAKKARASQQSGFTLIELLAVITIMGILMMVAIPAVSRTIENSRRDTFKNTAQEYINAVKNAVSADELTCGSNSIAASADGTYYFAIDSSSANNSDLLQSGGKSSWGSGTNKEVKGYVKFTKAHGGATGTATIYTYYISLVDGAGHGTEAEIEESALARSVIKSSGQTQKAIPAGKTTCTLTD